MKKVAYWALAHLVIAAIVRQIMLNNGKSEGEAQLAGHVAGAISGWALSQTV